MKHLMEYKVFIVFLSLFPSLPCVLFTYQLTYPLHLDSDLFSPLFLIMYIKISSNCHSLSYVCLLYTCVVCACACVCARNTKKE